MRLRFLGTAASEGYPDAFCDCANCERARERGGCSLRRRSSALIDDDLLIDLGPDLMAAALADGFSAHHSHPAHEELVEFAAARGYEVAYDGLVVDV